MKEADRRTSEEMYVSSDVLMERAALKTLTAIDMAFPSASRFLIVCGPGNNGGDGLALGRLLLESGTRPDIALIGGEEKCSPLEKKQLASVRALDPELLLLSEVPSFPYDVVVDALFGVSLNRKVSGEYAEAVERINALRLSGAGIVSIDIPSGIDALSGKVMGVAVKADVTVSCGFVKLGELLFPGASCCGRIIRAEIGITDKALPAGDYIHALSPGDIRLPVRRSNTHKGSYGKVLLAAGSADISGAAVLAAEAVLRSGAGMVRVFTHENNRTVIGCRFPEALISTYKDGEDITELKKRLSEEAAWADTIAAGPGLGTDKTALAITEELLKIHADRPLVIDADAINLIAGKKTLLKYADENAVFTPHIAEMSRLSGEAPEEIKADPVGKVRSFMEKNKTNIILKDARSVIGDLKFGIYVNLNGNHGMATAGSGDVLTGICAGILARRTEGISPFALAAAIHGRAGDRARDILGADGMCASDLLKYIDDSEETIKGGLPE